MEHRHHCLYCGGIWLCHEDCPLKGASVCAECAGNDKLFDSPRRLIGLPRTSWKIFDRLTEVEAERLRRVLRRGLSNPGS